MVGGFNRFRRPSVPEEVWNDQMVSLRELKQRLPDPPVLPVVAPVQQHETLPLPGFRVPQRVLADADLLFNGGKHTVVFSPSRPPISNVSNAGVDEQSITLINGRVTNNRLTK